MPAMRRTKIVATIGPACDEPGVLARVLASGVDVARLNASHGSIDDLSRRLAAVRAEADAAGLVVGVMLDLPGPKLRVGDMSDDAELREGSEFTLVVGECVGDSQVACVTYGSFPDDVSPGDRIMLDDGALELEVTRSVHDAVSTVVVRGGHLLSHKGVNVPGVRLSVDGVTPHDLELLSWGLESGIDLVAQSFVRTSGDIVRLRTAMGDRSIPIVAKIEKHEALEDLDAIISVADAVMVARGDLAVETAPEAVPPAQRRIVSAARVAGKPVIVATQMLESMTHSARPTRAEASDVATAVFQGADAVMLSEETAVGEYPAEAVATMDRICRFSERSGPPDAVLAQDTGAAGSPVAAAAVALARDTGARAIVTATQSGATARAVASLRPPLPVLAITPHAHVAGALALAWGVVPAVTRSATSIDETTDLAVDAARSRGLADTGERVVLTFGTTTGVTGSTDLIRVLTL